MHLIQAVRQAAASASPTAASDLQGRSLSCLPLCLLPADAADTKPKKQAVEKDDAPAEKTRKRGKQPTTAEVDTARATVEGTAKPEAGGAGSADAVAQKSSKGKGSKKVNTHDEQADKDQTHKKAKTEPRAGTSGEQVLRMQQLACHPCCSSVSTMCRSVYILVLWSCRRETTTESTCCMVPQTYGLCQVSCRLESNLLLCVLYTAGGAVNLPENTMEQGRVFFMYK